ncbi:hypothetical protein E2C01_084794 [Portunus trituberculatus]|uniref:Uncharacterized protein n=1 Tax=Portunus trituberculatus TaxID=210409 RepID=A0A5B7JBV4_PORTR|nr:hypothetical protein [Portunus trituberculatus]
MTSSLQPARELATKWVFIFVAFASFPLLHKKKNPLCLVVNVAAGVRLSLSLSLSLSHNKAHNNVRHTDSSTGLDTRGDTTPLLYYCLAETCRGMPGDRDVAREAAAITLLLLVFGLKMLESVKR